VLSSQAMITAVLMQKKEEEEEEEERKRESQRQSHFKADSQSVNMSWCRAHFVDVTRHGSI
jgi:hypothetical protein